METKYPTMFGLLGILILTASLVIPASLVSPAPVEADPDILRWSIMTTPNSIPGQTDSILSPSEIDRLVVGPNGTTFLAVVTTALPIMRLFSTGNAGRAWGVPTNLTAAMNTAFGAPVNVWDAAMAPDDANFWAVVISSDITNRFPNQVWVTSDGGTTWQNTLINNSITPPAGAVGDIYISCIDISPAYGGRRDIAVGTRDNMRGLLEKVWTLPVPGFGNWSDQSSNADGDNPGGAATWTDGDVFDIKFSPTYASDATLVVACSSNLTTDGATFVGPPNGCFINTAVRDLDRNTSVWGTPVWISDPATANTYSASANETVDMDLELPSDFSGQAASLRRFYVAVDDGGGWYRSLTDTGNYPPGQNITESGIYRIDDTTVYELMDTTTSFTTAGPVGKRISSIAYYGTYASGKLLAGEVRGDPCWATVPTWFTDSPTTCPIPCWYPAKKPTTGSAAVANCGTADPGWGNAQVAWSPDGATAYAGTGASEPGPYAVVAFALFAPGEWPRGMLNTRRLDESGFALSRNNGETWNQLSLIDTKIDKLTDVAPAADCTTVYLASTNTGLEEQDGVQVECNGFDSVWRTSSNPAVASPLAALSIGNVWERVLCRPTQVNCTDAQSEYAILRLAPDKEDGQIVFWGAGGAQGGGDVNIGTFAAGANTQAVAWSPDYGDYWANINPRLAVQDMSAESSTTLYILAMNGLVQRMPYTGTAWSSAIPNGQSSLTVTHTIDSLAEGNVLVGAQDTGNWEVSYSADSAATFSFPIGEITPTAANNHVIFDTNFADTGIFFLADDDARVAGGGPGAIAGTIYRNTIPWGGFENMLGAPGGAYHQNGYFGLAVAYTGDALYGSHNGVVQADAAGAAAWCTVERTIYRYYPIPKPHIPWDHLDIGTDRYATVCFPQFTLEPSSLKQCGCLTLDTDTELFAIDNNVYSNRTRTTGMLWAYTDCLAKVGPALITEDGLLVGCDPVSGRNQEINFQWEQLCLAQGYDIEIAKDEAFTMGVVDYIGTFTQATWVNTRIPFVPMAPAWIVPVNAAAASWVAPAAPGMFTQLECGHKYYWRVKVRVDAWAGTLRSPWSEVRSFTIKAGLPVSTPYYGPQVLSPNNGCIGCAVSPTSFSWSPFKGSTSYKFQLANDAAMTDIIAEDTVPTTAYEYTGTLDYNTNYFWRVMAVEPAPSDWSATFSFQTAAKGAPPAAALPTPGAGGQDFLSQPAPAIWSQLAAPFKAFIQWASSITSQASQSVGVGPVALWVWVVIPLAFILVIGWVIVMVLISKGTPKTRPNTPPA